MKGTIITSSDEKIATVDKNGVIHALKGGQTTVKVYVEGDEYNKENSVEYIIKVTDHNWNSDYTKDRDATCENEGQKSIHCSICNRIKEGSIQSINKLEHQYDAGVITREETCTKDGIKTYTCKLCGDTKLESIEASGHNIIVIEGKNPTCTEEGLSDSQVCMTCGKVFKEQITIPASGHTEAKLEKVDPTCTEDGHGEGKYCSVCDVVLEEPEVIKATGHKWTSWKTVKATTETAEGLQERLCEICGEKEEKVLSRLNHVHNMKKVNKVDATCEKEGHIEYYVCNSCNKLYQDKDGNKEITLKDTIIKPLGHSYSAWKVVKEATATQEGLKERTCKNCGDVEGETIPKLTSTHVHVLVKHSVKQATCEKAGNETYYECEDCGKLYSDSKATKEVKLKDVTIKATGHSWGKGKISKTATCSVEGQITYTCTHDSSHTKTENIGLDKDNHKGKTIIKNKKSATEKSEGYTGDIYCEDCDELLEKGTIIHKLAHTHKYSSWTKLNDTQHSRKCTDCNHEEKKNHKWDSGKITKKPTTTSTGIKQYTCTVCKATKNVTLKKLDSTGIADPETAPSKSQTAKEATKLKDGSELKNSTFNILQARASKIKDTSITLKWTKVKGAKSYTIYGNMCGTKYKYIKLFDINNPSTTTKVISKIRNTKMKKGTFYKFFVVANGKDSVGNTRTIATSKSIHIVTTGNKKKANFTGVTVNKAKATIKVKKAYTIKAKQIAPKGVKVSEHRKLAYESSNPTVATVNNKGKVTGKKKGKAIIYVYSQNGLYKTVTITVK